MFLFEQLSMSTDNGVDAHRPILCMPIRNNKFEIIGKFNVQYLYQRNYRLTKMPHAILSWLPTYTLASSPLSLTHRLPCLSTWCARGLNGVILILLMIYIDFVCLFATGVAQLISKLNNKPFDESDETLFEV